MKSISEYAGLRVFECVFMASVGLLLYSAVEKCFLYSLVLFIIVYISYSVIRKKTAKFVKPDGKYVLITGCDSGFGHGLAKYLEDLGFHVIATCLNASGSGATQLIDVRSENLHVLPMDVGSDDSVAECLKKVEELCGDSGLWGVVNNAAINFLGDVELCTMQQFIDVSNVNMFGMVRVTKAFLPLVRQTKGRVLNVTSVKGQLSLPCNSVYGITKYGGEAFSDVLRLEMKRFGIKVVIIEPGNFGGVTGCLNDEGKRRIKTDMDKMWENASEEIREVYGREYHDGIYNAAVESADTSCPTMQPVLESFADALLNEEPQERYMIPGGKHLFDLYCIFARLNWFIPVFIMDKLIIAKHIKGLPIVNALREKNKQC